MYLCLLFHVGKHREPQSITPKLFLPIIPIGIVAYAFQYAFVGQSLLKQLYTERWGYTIGWCMQGNVKNKINEVGFWRHFFRAIATARCKQSKLVVYHSHNDLSVSLNVRSQLFC